MENILFSDSCRTDCWGGVEKWVIMMAKSLQHRNINTHLICRPQGIIAERAEEANIPTFSASYKNSFDLITVFKILQIIKKSEIDLIICSTNLDIKLAGLAGKIAGIPVISRQGLALIKNSFKYKFLVRNFTSSIITNTQTIKKQYEDYGWFPSNFIQVIYNGVYPPHKLVLSEKLKKSLQTSSSHKVILSAGRLNTQKGFEYLIETAKIAQDNKQAWDFVILGIGDQESYLNDKISKYNLKNIKLLGFKKNIYEYYLCADVFVLSSVSEGTPNVVLEAMSYKCPVIATNVNGVNEIIENKRNGWIVPAKDSKAIYQAINECFANPEESQKIVENAFHIVCNKYTVENTTDQFVKYITQIFVKYEKDHHKNTQFSR